MAATAATAAAAAVAAVASMVVPTQASERAPPERQDQLPNLAKKGQLILRGFDETAVAISLLLLRGVVGRSVFRSIGRLVSHSVSRVVGLSVGRSAFWSVGRSADRVRHL